MITRRRAFDDTWRYVYDEILKKKTSQRNETLHDLCNLTIIISGDTLSKEKVFVTAKAQPASKARRIIALLVQGGAEARPKGFSNLMPHMSTLKSTSSMTVWNLGNCGVFGIVKPWNS